MNLLLLLSAMLSALTGIGSNARVPAAAAIAAKIQVARVARITAITPVSRPAQSIAALSDIARMPMASVLTLVADHPLYASRRRE